MRLCRTNGKKKLADFNNFLEEFDPKLRKKLLNTRRKSVAFSVCTVDNKNMTFDLDQKKVFLGTLPSKEQSYFSSVEKKENEKFGSVQGISLNFGERKKKRCRLPSSGARRMSVPAVIPILLEEPGRITNRVKL